MSETLKEVPETPEQTIARLTDKLNDVEAMRVMNLSDTLKAEAKVAEQAAEIERLRCAGCGATGSPEHYCLKCCNEDTDELQAKLRAVEATCLSAYQALAAIHGDAEDCDDCGTIAETGEDGCRIHTGTRQAKLMWEAIEAIEDALGPCWCGHTRAEHDDCDERICDAKDCTCRCFKLSKLTAILEAKG